MLLSDGAQWLLELLCNKLLQLYRLKTIPIMISQFCSSEAQMGLPGISAYGFMRSWGRGVTWVELFYLEALGRSDFQGLSGYWKQWFFAIVGLKFLFPCRLSAGGCSQSLEAVHIIHMAPCIFKTVMLHQVFFTLWVSLIFLVPSFSLSSWRKLFAFEV